MQSLPLVTVGVDWDNETTARAFLGRLGEKDAVAPDDGSGIALVGQIDLPMDVLVRGPGEWQVLLGRVALAVGTSPGGPVGGDTDEGGDKNG